MVYKKITLGLLLFVSTCCSTYAQNIIEASFFQNKYSVLLAEAKRLKKPMILVFSANWCSPCLKMEKETFSDEYVASFISLNYLAKKVDVTEWEGVGLSNDFRISLFPTTLFLDYKGNVTGKMEGFFPVNFFIQAITNNMVKNRKTYQGQTAYDVYLSSL